VANRFYAPGRQREERVKALFARVAARYDLLNDLQSCGLHRLWKQRLVKLAAPKAGDRALDVCCGTADLCFAFADQGIRVVGLDFSQQMLEVALARKARGQTVKTIPDAEVKHGMHSGDGPRQSDAAHTSLDFVQGDALRLPFADNTFDIVSVGYGLRNLVDWAAGLEEMRRVARPGGGLLVLDLGKPDNPLWRALYFGYLRLFVPCLGWLFCGSASAYSYLLESLKHYPAQQGVADKMRQLKLTNISVIHLLGGAMSINYGEK
jgi:demethylmenaquinone methyltransferase / 2-methoxy-6-polyprenyl-1,4-benzoquinol methylase